MTETKRDVFDEVRYKFRNFKNEHRHGMYASPDSIDHYLSDALKRYAAALPDDLPVIPKVVSEYIKWGKKYDIQLYMMYYSQLIHRPGFKKLTYDAISWIISSSNIFARAWVLGVWRVDETGEIVKLEEEK